MYDPIFAKSFSRYEQKRFGFWAVLICTIMVLSICMDYNPHFHPLSLIGNAMNVQLSINAAQDRLIPKDSPILSPPAIEAKAAAMEPISSTFGIKEPDQLFPPLVSEARDVMLKPIESVPIKDKENPLKLENNTTKEEEPHETLMMKKSRDLPSRLDRNTTSIHEANEEEQTCNIMENLSDYCEMRGDIRIEPNSSTIFIVSSNDKVPGINNQSWSIKPYARKGNSDAMASVRKWTVKLVSQATIIPSCTVNHSIPAVLFSSGGYSGNMFHDFSDLLVPVYSNSQQFNGDVQLLVTDYASWWISKYNQFFSKLSRHPIIPIDQEKKIHCYSKMILGLRSYKELGIDSSKFSNALSINHFRQFLRSTYSLNRTSAVKLKRRGKKRPRLMLISRSRTRIIRNEDQIVRLARKLGYEVILAEANVSTNATLFAQLVNSCDVLMGVHGAGLTNMVFLPQNAVLLQIIPFGGMDGYARNDFGKPSFDMNISYMEYKVQVTESSLIEQYPLDHAILRDPLSIHKQGWGAIRSIYLDKQDVKIDIQRFRPTLTKIIKILRRY